MRLRLFSLLLVLVLGASAGLSAAPKSSRRKDKATVSIRESRSRQSTTRERRKRAESTTSRTERTRDKLSSKSKKRSAKDDRPASKDRKRDEKKSAKSTTEKKSAKSAKPAATTAAAKKTAGSKATGSTAKKPAALTGDKKTAPTPTVADAKPQAAPSAATPATLAGADEAYQKKSYVRALRGYRQAVNKKQVPASRAAQVDYRIARCLEHTKDWNNATASMQGVSSKYPNSPWDARAKGAMMLLYLRVPHNAWKVGDRFYRGELPKTEDAAQPVQVDLTAEDQRKAVVNGEQAKALWEKLRARTGFETEEADLDADLARVVSGLQMSPWADSGKWAAPSDPQWMIDTASAYDPTWAPPKKIVYLFTHAEQMGDDSQKPLARLALAHWLRGYHSAMEYAALEDVDKGERKIKPYPYQDLSARKTLETLIADFPKHPESEHARLTLADWLNTDGKFTEALAAYEAFQQDFPKSPWLGNAKAAAAEITRLVLSIDAPQPQAPGKKAKLSLDARNIQTLKLTAYRVKLEELIKDARILGRPREGISEIFALLGQTKGIRKFYQPDPVTWEATLDEKGHHVPYQGEIETPLIKNGAYIIEANGGPVRQSVALLITDLAVIQVSEAGKTHAFVVNAATGAPVFEANALIREVYQDDKEKMKVSAVTRTTDPDGLAEKANAPAAQYSRDISTLAWKGDRYAFTGGGQSSPLSNINVREQTAYLYSDRPVYRPGQKMNFRALLAQRNEQGVWRPLPGQKVKLQITDPKGAVVFTDEAASGERGTLHGDYTFDSQPPLGTYAMTASWQNEDKSTGQGAYSFRVEEYKKPEFEVTVAPSSTGVARIGEQLKAKIKARYYFGAPVAKAKVTYKVSRSEFFPNDPFPIPFAHLYSAKHPTEQSRWWDPDWVPFPNGEVASGTVTTDANGEAEITIDSALKDPRLKDRHVEFAIHAEVTDASRRTIEGNGTARALARQFDAFARVRAGFYSPGDRLQADVRTLDANGKPVAVAGSARVLKLTAVNEAADSDRQGREAERPQKYTEEEVAREPLRTNDEGRAVFAWTATAPGLYEIRFEARDAWESLVVGRTRAWVSGEGASAGVFHNKHVQIIAQQDNYRIGDTAKVLIVTDEPGITVLLTQEAGDRLLERRVIRLKDLSTVLEIPLTQAQSPDITIAVTGVRERQLFRSTAQLYVPPAEQLLDVSVKADKAEYKPGEQAKLIVQARDHAGKGVVTSVSVGVADASVYYIQGEIAPPIQAAFYAGERGSGVSPRESLSQSFDTAQEDEQPVLKEGGRQWQFPDGLGSMSPDDFGIEAVADDERPFANTLSMGRQMNGPPAGLISLGGAGGGQGILGREVTLAYAPKLAKAGVAIQPNPVRSQFADTAFWVPEVETDASGNATVTVTWPDNLTTWRATVRGWSDTAQVGEGTTDVTTSKDLLVRLQAPRFFMERDEVVLSANVHNYTDRARRIDVRLELDGEVLMPAGTGPVDAPMPRKVDVPRADKRTPEKATRTSDAESAAPLSDPELSKTIEVPVGGETRVDWRVRVDRAGLAKIRVVAEGTGSDDDVGDAVEMSFPAYTHGIEKLVSKSGMMFAEEGGKAKSAKLSIDLPAERAPSSGELIVQVSPTLAGTMLDALPYLVDYPYGCTEQTLSRFVPAAITSKTLTDLGLDLGDLKKRADLEFQRLRDDAPMERPSGDAFSYPEGSPGRRDVQRLMLARAQWASEKSPVYQPTVLKSMTAEGMARLARFQNKDGGWGWWQNDNSTDRMTAYVVQGLLTARQAGIAVPSAMIERGMKWLDGHFKKTTHAHDSVLVGYVLTLDPKRAPGVASALLERSYRGRNLLTAYTLALLTMSLKNGGKIAEAKICLDNLENTAKVDAEASTCYWPKNDGGRWNWYNDDLETAAAALRAYLALSPKHRLVGPTVRWIAGSRDGLAWQSTRGTALAIEALAEYVTLNKELQPDQKVTVEVAGGFKRTFALTPEDALLGDHRLVVPTEALGQGPQSITITREGSGNLYYNAYLRYYSLEEGIPAAGSDLKIRRRYFKLTKPAERPAKGAPVTADGYLRTPIRTGERLTSGDLIDVELTIEAKNSYDYLVFEDMKPAGCEPVELRSGSRYGGDLCSNMELRDEKVSFFVTWFPQGRRQITYRVRAEIPGMFHALPTNGYAMYAPDLRATSDESQFGIEDAK